MHYPETAVTNVPLFLTAGGASTASVNPSPLSGHQCSFCPATFSSLRDKKSHVSKNHGSTMPFNCQLCGKGYETARGLEIHTQGQHMGKTYPCPVCDSKLSQKSALRVHLRKIHNASQCFTCSGIFNVGEEYTQHVLHCH